MFTRIGEESQKIVILESARKSARKHDFRNFFTILYDAIMGLEKTELPLILQDKSETERQLDFYSNYHCEISRESAATLKSYHNERTFMVPAHGAQLFEWHIKINGNRTRIHYWIDKAGEKVYIGHCGKHLPVVG